MNELLNRYKGPVLIAQGALDPLNNATMRANLFRTIRQDITIDLLPLGHCPMDEDPVKVSLF
jgi:pimeloyl-ACP methyl ester carboxylesterase